MCRSLLFVLVILTISEINLVLSLRGWVKQVNITTLCTSKYANCSSWLENNGLAFAFDVHERLPKVEAFIEIYGRANGIGKYNLIKKDSLDFCRIVNGAKDLSFIRTFYDQVVKNKDNHFPTKCPVDPVKYLHYVFFFFFKIKTNFLFSGHL